VFALTSVLVTPIKPVFAYRIFVGKKKHDLRKLTSKTPQVRAGDRVVLYVTGTIKAFMGEYTVGGVITGKPDYIIRVLSETLRSGVSEEDFSYIKGSELALAIEVLNPIVYKVPIAMKEVLRIFPDYNPPIGIQKLSAHEPVVTLIFDKARSLSVKH